MTIEEIKQQGAYRALLLELENTTEAAIFNFKGKDENAARIKMTDANELAAAMCDLLIEMQSHDPKPIR